MKNTLQAGFARVDITPPMGIPVAGYFEDRFAEGVLDPLEIQALALSDGNNKAVILSVDIIGINAEDVADIKEQISERTGLLKDSVYIASTHTHTGPSFSKSFVGELPPEWGFYRDTVKAKLIDAAYLALSDLQSAKMGYGTAIAPNIAFIRRFRMKDGKVRTNPGVGNPDIVAPIGEVDETVSLLRFKREKDDIALISFGVHPDTVGGSLISADYPRFVRETVENAIPNTRCIFLNGIQGDVNHVNVNAKGGDKNGLHPTFDGCDRGYEHAMHMGRTIAGAALQVYGKVNFTDVDSIRFAESICEVPANKGTPEQLPLAREYAKLHAEGRDGEIPFKEMELTTVVAESLRILRLENGPDSFFLPLAALAIGPVALVGISGEPFTGIGRGIKEGSPFELTVATCATDGYEGYFPMQEAYDEGGYEARSSSFKAGVAERLIDEGVKLLNKVK
ncbi:MAG: hypothetical protein IJ408_04390 [Clostridia bacterium]|nr:hypothetical protein [Clostridia bacterium]